MRRHFRFTLAKSALFIAMGLSLVLQSDRWRVGSVAYAFIFANIDPQWWGLAYLFTALVLILSCVWINASFWYVTHALGFSLLLYWFIALIFRYATDGQTTPVTSLFWALMLYVAYLSATELISNGRSPDFGNFWRLRFPYNSRSSPILPEIHEYESRNQEND